MEIAQSKAQLRKNYIWNTLGSAANALSSAILLLMTTRILGLEAAGIFAIAFALSQQFQVIGHFEIRSYQATDSQERFSFATYLGARYVSCLVMCVVIVGYTFYTNGITLVALSIMLIALLKLFDAFEDVFHGMFQQRGRLDIAGRAFFVRIIACMLGFCIAAFITRDLCSSCIVAFILSAFAFFFCNVPFAQQFVSLRPSFKPAAIIKLFWTCLPLCIGSFFLVYITNAPKYAIDMYLTRDYQALYSILFMPSLVINLLSGFVFKPLLTDMALCWSQARIKDFAQIIFKGFMAICAATLVTCLAAWFLGIEVLGALYGVSLAAYKLELMLLIVGGLFNASGIILYYAVVTMRMQKYIFAAYGLASLFAFCAYGLVDTYKIRGAVMIYDAAMLIVALVFLCVTLVGFMQTKRSKRSKTL